MSEQAGYWHNVMVQIREQLSRIGLARELMVPLSFDRVGPMFSFVHVNEAQRYAALHDSMRRPVPPGMTPLHCCDSL